LLIETILEALASLAGALEDFAKFRILLSIGPRVRRAE